MYLPLLPNVPHTSGNHTKIRCVTDEQLKQLSTFKLSDTEKPGWFFEKQTFKLSNTEELEFSYCKHIFQLSITDDLEFFYHKRLEFISKKVLVKITFCWLQILARRLLGSYSKAKPADNLSKRVKSC
jgi:hypothetical protein